jgi:Cu/Ag efflux protein CusF
MRYAYVTLCLTALFVTGCSRPKPENKEPLQQYSLHGEIIRLDGQANLATIHHQKVEGYMESMTMQFPVKEKSEFDALHPSDCIDAKLFVQGFDIWVGDIHHVQAAPGTCVVPPPAAEPEKK